MRFLIPQSDFHPVAHRRRSFGICCPRSDQTPRFSLLVLLRGFDPRDQDNYFTGMIAFVALFNLPLHRADIEQINSELADFRSQFDIDDNGAKSPSVTVASVADFTDAVNNAFVVNFTFSSAIAYDAQSWYIYRHALGWWRLQLGRWLLDCTPGADVQLLLKLLCVSHLSQAGQERHH